MIKKLLILNYERIPDFHDTYEYAYEVKFNSILLRSNKNFLFYAYGTFTHH